MKVVGIRELKNRLSEYVRIVRAGEAVLVTDRGEVVAELSAPGAAASAAESKPALEAVARRGGVTIGAPNQPDLYPLLARIVPEGFSKRLLHEERGEL